MDDLYLLGLTCALLADSYLRDGLPDLELELLYLLLEHLRLIYQIFILFGDFFDILVVVGL